MSRSRSHQPRGKPSESPSSMNSTKVFVTNMDGSIRQEDLQEELRKLFQKYGKLKKLIVKKSRNRDYSFAFLEYDKIEEAEQAVKDLDQYQLHGKKMRVRKDRQNQGCFTCHKSGHFARQCPQKKYEDRTDKRQSDYRGGYRNRERDNYRDSYRDNYRERQRQRDKDRDREGDRYRQKDYYYKQRQRDRERDRDDKGDHYHDREKDRNRYRSRSKSYRRYQRRSKSRSNKRIKDRRKHSRSISDSRRKRKYSRDRKNSRSQS